MTAWDTLDNTLREPLAPVCYRLDSALNTVRVEEMPLGCVVVGEGGGDLACVAL